MFIELTKTVLVAVGQIFFLAAVGYFLVKRRFLDDSGLDSLSRIIIEISLPFLIFSELVKNFSYSLYPYWWVFPLLSILISLAGFCTGGIFLGFIKEKKYKIQFLSLVAFQNSGYLPLVLVASLLPREKLEVMLIYLFLFLLGFNLLMWSVGVYLITFGRARRFELASFFSPPVIATLISLLVVFLGLNKFIPDSILRPIRMVGDMTFPLAMFIVGGNLAKIHFTKLNKKAIFFVVLAKLVILPGLGLVLITRLRLPELIGLLILMELAVPPAISLSTILQHYKKEDLLISQGIFFGHLFSIISLPLFLGLYFALSMNFALSIIR
ncbi:MAG: AEC family transporter [Candidatus Omnitrophica bacterium]|nr:AEC family transporter [Candidatus Omnitrophota bacterium]